MLLCQNILWHSIEWMFFLYTLYVFVLSKFLIITVYERSIYSGLQFLLFRAAGNCCMIFCRVAVFYNWFSWWKLHTYCETAKREGMNNFSTLQCSDGKLICPCAVATGSRYCPEKNIVWGKKASFQRRSVFPHSLWSCLYSVFLCPFAWFSWFHTLVVSILYSLTSKRSDLLTKPLPCNWSSYFIRY